jgi:hypothetical protein
MSLRHTWLAGLLAVSLGASVAPAALAATPTDRAVPRFGFTALVAGNALFIPSAGYRLSYRLPAFADRLDVFAGWDPMNAAFTTAQVQFAHVGLRYYFLTEGAWQPHALASGGVTYFTNPTMSYDGPFGALGIGTDWMPTRHFGLTGNVTANYPMTVRLELGAKLAI